MDNGSQARPDGASTTWGLDDNPGPWALSPSDFAFLWDGCKRCFYLKVARKQSRPRSPFPSVFGKIDRAMKDHYLGERAETLAQGMPAGVIGGGDRWVKSSPVTPSGSTRSCIIRGQVDVLVDCDDGTKGIVDFKTTVPKADHVATYGRQLHAYAWALEHPSSGPPVEVGALGLCASCPTPTRPGDRLPGCSARSSGSRCPRGDEKFLEFLGEVLSILEGIDRPPASANCPWCQMRRPPCGRLTCCSCQFPKSVGCHPRIVFRTPPGRGPGGERRSGERRAISGHGSFLTGEFPGTQQRRHGGKPVATIRWGLRTVPFTIPGPRV